jgi:hypothetical protein
MWLSQLKNMHKQNSATQSVLKQSLFKQNMLKQYEVWGTFVAISGIGHLCLLVFLFFLSGTPTTHVSLLVNKRLSGKQVDVLLANAYSRRGARSSGAKNRITGGGVRAGAKNSGLARNSGLKKSVKAGTNLATKKNNAHASSAKSQAESAKKAAHKTTLGSKIENKNKESNKIAQQKLAQEKRQKELEQKKAQAKKIADKKAKKNKPEKNKAEKKKELAKKVEQKKEAVPEQKLEKVPEPVAPDKPALEQASQPEAPSLVNAALGLLGLEQTVGADIGADQVNQDDSMPVMIEEDGQDIESLLRYVALQKECSRCWHPPVGVDRACACSIKIYVDQHGKVYAIDMVEKSGVLMFDSAAKMTVYAMELPKWAYNKSLVITFRQE